MNLLESNSSSADIYRNNVNYTSLCVTSSSCPTTTSATQHHSLAQNISKQLNFISKNSIIDEPKEDLEETSERQSLLLNDQDTHTTRHDDSSTSIIPQPAPPPLTSILKKIKQKFSSDIETSAANNSSSKSEQRESTSCPSEHADLNDCTPMLSQVVGEEEANTLMLETETAFAGPDRAQEQIKGRTHAKKKRKISKSKPHAFSFWRSFFSCGGSGVSSCYSCNGPRRRRHRDNQNSRLNSLKSNSSSENLRGVVVSPPPLPLPSPHLQSSSNVEFKVVPSAFKQLDRSPVESNVNKFGDERKKERKRFQISSKQVFDIYLCLLVC